MMTVKILKYPILILQSSKVCLLRRWTILYGSQPSALLPGGYTSRGGRDGGEGAVREGVDGLQGYSLP